MLKFCLRLNPNFHFCSQDSVSIHGVPEQVPVEWRHPSIRCSDVCDVVPVCGDSCDLYPAENYSYPDTSAGLIPLCYNQHLHYITGIKPRILFFPH